MSNYSMRTPTESDAILTLSTEAMAAKMNAGEPFTALDISNVLKTKNLPVRHREVSAVVRGLYAGGGMNAFGYVRDLITVSTPDGFTQAYLYRHGTQAVAEYSRDAQDALPPVPAEYARPLDDAVPAGEPLSPLAEVALQGMVGNAVISGSGSTAYCGAPSLHRTRGAFRRDGAVAIPRNLIEQAGYQVGDLLVLTHDSQTDTLALQAAPSGANGVIGAFVKVWGDLRVRVAKTKLRIAGYTVPLQKPNFVIDNGTLRIEP